jgi:putative membrane protein
MSDDDRRAEGLGPRVIEMERTADKAASAPVGPRLIETEETGRVVAAPAAMRSPMVAAPARRRGPLARFALGALGVAFAGWLGVDAYLWIASAFDSGPALGWLAAAVAAAGITGAGLIIGREARSFLRLRSVEECQQRFAAGEAMRGADMQDALRRVIAVIPQDAQSRAAIAAFQRKAQRHHTPAQQLELFSQTVLTPLDRRAEAVIRRASARAFGVVAISPTAVTDAIFFIAVSIRMVREVAACYGHRPTTVATGHLLRRLVVEAGRLGAIDLASATLTQHIGGALAERLAAGAAESVYATQRMARLGLVTMELCRPVPFAREQVPGILSSLIGNIFAGGREKGRT